MPEALPTPALSTLPCAPEIDVVEKLSEAVDGLDPNRLTYERLRTDPEILAIVEAADAYLSTIGYTDHGLSHLSRVAGRAYHLLRALEAPQRECELAAIAGLLHDIGNVVHREGHAHHSALMCFSLLRERGTPLQEVMALMTAVANHDESEGEPISMPSAALIVADKSDVLRSRVRNPHLISFDIHDRVNYAAKRSEVTVDRENHRITLALEIDTKISQVMEYFEIFMSRMRMCRRSAHYLNCDFQLVINQVQLL
jgi:hypothetical protein